MAQESHKKSFISFPHIPHIPHFPHFPDLFHRKQNSEWGYEGNCGPQTWPSKFPNAKGMYQSPINIQTDSCVFDARLETHPLCIKYSNNSCFQIKNTGHTFQVDALNKNSSIVTGGPVNEDYRFLQFHMHWGDTFEKGSEHLVDDMPYAAELHFVNWNYSKYKNPDEACKSSTNDGLVVLAQFIKVGDFNEEFDKLCQYMHKIHLMNQHVPVDQIDLYRLLTNNLKEYWTYPGSLTTPPCTECVQWVIFKEPIEISMDQLETCHSLYEVSKTRLCNEHTIIKYNDRPICNLNNRIVRKSFLV